MTHDHGLVIEDIRQRIVPAQQVYDLNGDAVGFVDQFDLDAGWMKVEGGGLVPQKMYIPFSAITGIDPHEIYLSLSADTLLRDYASPAPRTTVVEGSETEAVAITTEPSGYDGTPLVVDRVPIDTLRHRIELGMRVFAADAAEVGTVKRYNPATGWMVVETGVFTDRNLRVPLADVLAHPDLRVPPAEVFARELHVPLAVVASVVGDSREIYLVVHATDLERMQQAEPADALSGATWHDTR